MNMNKGLDHIGITQKAVNIYIISHMCQAAMA